MPLKWSTPRPPGQDGSSYDHVIAQTPLGPLYIEWKSWKENDSPTCDIIWGKLIVGDNLEEVKSLVQQEWNNLTDEMIKLRS